MRDHIGRWVTPVGLALASALVAACGKVGPGGATQADATEQWQTIGKYCNDCHNRDDFTANIAFDRMTPESVAHEPKIFEATVRKLRGRMMPPPGDPQPDQKSVDALVSWLERTLDAAAASRPHPSRVALHRLNRQEYGNAVRDLLALDIDATTLLPQDDQLHGFDNIADALQVSPSFIEQYVTAARSVAVQAVGQRDVRPGSKTYEAAPGTPNSHVDGLPLGTRGGILAEHQFPADGEYEISIADMAQALWVDDMEFANTVVVTLDGRRIYQTVIGGDEDMKAIDQLQDPAVETINARLKGIRFSATAGPHKIGVTFLRRTAAESDDRLQMFVPGGGQDHVLQVRSFQLSGPFNPSGVSATPSRERIFGCYPSRAEDEEPCAEEIMTSLAVRAFRRPLTEQHVGNLWQYYRDGAKNGGFEEGIRSAITGILASPYFLYRAEHTPAGLAAGEFYRIRGLDLASKLSFFLWNSVPDDELRDLAVRGALDDEKVRKQQVARMLADPRAATLASNFAARWLNLQRLDEVAPDRSIFPYASGGGDPRDDFVKETTLFVDSIFRSDRSVVDLLTADHTFVNERVAYLYGIRDVKGPRFRRVQLEDPMRFGLLGKGAILMASSYPNRTSVVLRGAFILENITGTPPAAPPPNVEAFPEKDVGTPKAKTVREIMAKHRANPTCFACHGVLDPLGFSLENFDAVGVWRERDRFAGTPIDASAQLPDGTLLNGPLDLRNALLRRPDQFVQTLTERLLTYALGRQIEYYDMPAVRKVVREAKEKGYRFDAIVWAIVESEPFQLREVPSADPGETVTTARNVTQ
jgi:mono/diheme cytochrome c family protein